MLGKLWPIGLCVLAMAACAPGQQRRGPGPWDNDLLLFSGAPGAELAVDGSAVLRHDRVAHRQAEASAPPKSARAPTARRPVPGVTARARDASASRERRRLNRPASNRSSHRRFRSAARTPGRGRPEGDGLDCVLALRVLGAASPFSSCPCPSANPSECCGFRRAHPRPGKGKTWGTPPNPRPDGRPTDLAAHPASLRRAAPSFNMRTGSLTASNPRLRRPAPSFSAAPFTQL